MQPPFLTLNPPPSPFNLSPPLSPKSYSEHGDNHSDVPPTTPGSRASFQGQSDLSRISGFPQASGFNFGPNSNSTSPVSPSGERQPSDQSAASLIPIRPASNAIIAPPGGVYREQDLQAGIEAPPPYERYSRHSMPGGGLSATRSSIAAGQLPTGSSFPAPVHGRGRHHRVASAGAAGAPRSFNGRRQPYPLTLTDTRSFGRGNLPQLVPQRKQVSWRIFGSTEGIDGGMEKKPLTRKGRWIICIIVSTILITVVIVGALVGTMKPRGSGNGAAADNVSGFPALPTGLAVVTPQDAPETPTSACVLPKTLWSCDLPPDTTFPTNSSKTDTIRLPTFMFTISVRNDTTDSSSSTLQWAPFPEQVPNDTEYASLAGVDGIQSGNKSGEKTPFYLSMQTDQNPIVTRDIETETENVESVNQGTSRRRSRRSVLKRQASQIPALMLPMTLRNQPLRLFDRGLDTEHYGFFVYYKKTIHVLAVSPSDVTPYTAVNDANGGVSALVSNSNEVTWDNTRFKVEIWTKKRASGEMDLINAEGQRLSSQTGAFDNFFPYPVSVTEDRNGDKGDVSSGRNFQRTVVEEVEGKGCFCEWRNWRAGVN